MIVEVCCVVFALAGLPPAVPEIAPETDARHVVVSCRLPDEPAAGLPEGFISEEAGQAWLRLAIVDEATNRAGAPVFARYERRGARLVLTPRLGLVPGRLYRAASGAPGARAHEVDYRVPEPMATAASTLEAIEPGGEALPANLLKFYLLFSRPMREGREIFAHIHLIDDEGREIESPWRPTELWNSDARRLTLWIHPGRVKQGVNLREEFGPVLEAGRSYRLLIDRGLRDIDGRELEREATKTFRAAAEDHRCPDPSRWQLAAPPAASTEPLRVVFDEPLDRYLVERYLEVRDARGELLAGRGTVEPRADGWSFRPERPWQDAVYKLVIGENLEDLAGNTPARVFDRDLNAAPSQPPVLGRAFRPTP